MTRFVSHALAALLALGAISAVPETASAADLSAGQQAYPSVCGDAWVLRAIGSRFRHQVMNVPNLPDVAIDDFQRIHLHRHLPASVDNPIGRTYCGATAILSDGRGRDIWYLVEQGQGLASIGDNVEFCVAGFDRWNVYNGHCRVLR